MKHFNIHDLFSLLDIIYKFDSEVTWNFPIYQSLDNIYHVHKIH
jgi:hypothetical protein